MDVGNFIHFVKSKIINHQAFSQICGSLLNSILLIKPYFIPHSDYGSQGPFELPASFLSQQKGKNIYFFRYKLHIYFFFRYKLPLLGL
jgi:hypothetical protein